jgi:hypothetical protein
MKKIPCITVHNSFTLASNSFASFLDWLDDALVGLFIAGFSLPLIELSECALLYRLATRHLAKLFWRLFDGLVPSFGEPTCFSFSVCGALGGSPVILVIVADCSYREIMFCLSWLLSYSTKFG